MTERSGLAGIWEKVVGDIHELVRSDCYEAVNAFMSLLTVSFLRDKASGILSGGTILDAGAGPGYTSIHACRNTRVRRIVLLDPVPSMLSSAIRSVKLHCREIDVEAVAGVFEYLPLADNSVDGVISTFAFRDAVDHRIALDEFYRILRRGGELVILDIYRPEDPVTNFSVKLYFRLTSSLAAVLLGCIGKLRNYASFINTIERMMTPTELLRELKIRFESISFKALYPGVGLWTAIK